MITRLGILLLWLLLPYFSSSQSYSNDLEFWSSGAIKFRISKDLSIDFEQAGRFNNNWQSLSSTYSELGAGYKYNKHWSFAIGYRFAQPTNKPLAIHHDHRYTINVKYLEDFKIGGQINEIEASVRVRYQSKYRDLFVSEDGLIPTNYIRTKFLVSADLDRTVEPYAGCELFYRVRYTGSYIDAYRVFVGLDWAIDANQGLDFKLMRESEIQVREPKSALIISVSYAYKIKWYNRKKGVTQNNNARWL